MYAQTGPRLPGTTAGDTWTPRELIKNGQAELMAGTFVLSGANSRDTGNDPTDIIRNGMPLGKITTGGLLAPSILGVTTNAEAIGSTSIQASAAVVTELVRRIGASGTFKLIGPAVANGQWQEETVTYSAASTTNITCTAITKNFAAGAYICPTDGSEYPVTLLCEESAGCIKVTDENSASMNVPIKLLIGGVIDYSQILFSSTDTGLRAFICDNLRAHGRYVFDDTHTAVA